MAPPTGIDDDGPAAALRQRLEALRRELDALGPDPATPAPDAGERVCPRDGVPTRFVCTRCGISICPDCQVATDVGLRCPTHGGATAPAPRRRPWKEVAAATLVGVFLATGVVVGRWSATARPLSTQAAPAAVPSLAPTPLPTVTPPPTPAVTPATPGAAPTQSPSPAPEPTGPQALLDVPDLPTVVALNGAGVDFAPGRRVVWTPADALITPTVDRPAFAGCAGTALAPGNEVHIQIEGDVSYGVTFIAPQGQALTATSYPNVGTSSSLSCDPPGGAFDQAGPTTCGHTATFTVLEIAFRADGSLARLAAVFEQRCAGSGYVLRGEVRYNATVPAVPV